MYIPKCSLIQHFCATLTIALYLCAGCSESTQAPHFTNPTVRLSTTMGVITLELDIARAPVSVANFLKYLKASYYDSTIFHRVIPGFVIQGGQFTQHLERKEPKDSIICESYNGLSNLRGTIGVARGSSPHSGTCQFFINVVDNTALDKRDDSYLGYAVFGRVTGGMDVVDAIASVPTSTQQMPNGSPMYDVPVTPVIVLSARRIK